jgi:hypothetical protein
LVVTTKTFWSNVGPGNAARELAKELVKLGVDLVAVVHADSHVESAQEPIPNKEPIPIDVPLPPPLRYYLVSKEGSKTTEVDTRRLWRRLCDP